MEHTAYTCRRLGPESLESIEELFFSVFSAEPWNDDWSDREQLRLYMLDLLGQSNSLAYGLFEGETLLGASLGQIRHWYTGTEYHIDELFIRTGQQGQGLGAFFLKEIESRIRALGFRRIFLLTSRDVPAYRFYQRNGFEELNWQVSFTKNI